MSDIKEEYPAVSTESNKSEVSHINTEQAYHGLSDSIFNWHAILLHISCLAIAMLVQQIEVVFDLVGAITCSFSIFLFPAIAYLVAFTRFNGKIKDSRKADATFYLLASWVFIVLGVTLIIMAIYLNIMRAIGKFKDD